MKDHAQLLARYQRLRHAGVEVNQTLVKRLGKDVLHEGGEKLGILHDGALILHEENEGGILMDFCIHDVRRQGLTAVERFLAEAPPAPGSDDRVVAEALAQARFSLYLVEGREMGLGVQVRDLIGDASHLVVDRSFAQTAQKDMVIAFRLIAPDNITMTTGAALPVCQLPKDGREKALHDVMTIMGGLLSRARDCQQWSEGTATILNALLSAGRSTSISYVNPDDLGRGTRASGKPSVGRYDPCPCGSGKKFKFCCGARR